MDGQAFHGTDLAQLSRPLPWVPLMLDAGLSACAMLPLTVNQQVCGVLVLVGGWESLAIRRRGHPCATQAP